jgi:hypothetical protein
MVLSFVVLAADQASGQDLIVYPAKGQSQKQMEKDKLDCYSWAKQQSGFDPMQTPAPAPAPPPPGSAAGGVVRGGAGGAALGAAVGGIAGGWSGAGKGADEGIQDMRDSVGWTATVTEEKGKFVVTAAGDQEAFIVCGACLPLP